MSITGHKSVNSLSIYQKVSTDEKLAMAYSMSYYIQSDKPGLPSQNNVQLIQNNAIASTSAPHNPNTVQVRMATQKKNPENSTPLQEVPDPGNLIVPYESEDPLMDDEIPDFDLNAIMETIEKENNTLSLSQNANSTSVTTTTTSITQQRQVVKRSPKLPMFNNCKIGNIHIHKD